MHTETPPTVLSTNIGSSQPCPTGEDRGTGIHKLPCDVLETFIPGPNYGDGPGVHGDFVGNTKHHGGADKAIYAFAREELDFWETQNQENYPNGSFGENLTTKGIDWSQVIINQRVKIGTTLVEVSVPRQPCRTFAEWLNLKGWVKTFTDHGDCGAYLRVIIPGEIRPGDALELMTPPLHGITMGQAFAAKMGNKELARKVYDAACLPEHHHKQLEKLLR